MNSNKDKKSYYTIGEYRIPRLPVLSFDEFIMLLEKYRNGDLEAGKTIVEHNYGLVMKEISTYTNNINISNLDLFQEGCLGLMEAIDRYDMSTGYQFSTYAVCWIRQRIRSYVSNNTYKWVVGKEMYSLIKKLNTLECELSAKYGRAVTKNELAQELGVSIDKIVDALKILNHEVSLDAPIQVDSDTSEDTIGDFVPSDDPTPEDIAIQKDKRETVLEILDQVCKDKNEKDIILKRFGFYDTPKTLEEIAKDYHVTRERIRQIESKVLRKIRARYKHTLKPYYDDNSD